MKHEWDVRTGGSVTRYWQMWLGLAAILIAAVPVFAQPTQTWTHQISVQGMAYDTVHDMVVTPDGRVVVVGAWHDMWRVRCLDLGTGAFLWEVSGGQEYWMLTSVVSADDGSGDVIVGGYERFSPFEIYIARIDAQGHIVWERTLENPNYNRVFTLKDLLRIGPDRVYGCGQFNSQTSIGWVNIDNPNSHQVFSFDREEGPWTQSLAKYSDNSMLLGGNFFEGYTFFANVLHVTTSGQMLWVYRSYDMRSADCLARTLDGTTMLGGYHPYSGTGVYAARVEAVDSNGEYLWSIEQGVDYFSVFNDICMTDPAGSDYVYVAGQVVEELDGPNRQLVHKVSSTGEIIWTLYGADGGSTDCEYTAVDALPDGGLVVAGTLSGYSVGQVVIERYDP